MATPGTTTRDDLLDRLDAYLDALVANDPGRLGPGAARLTENGQEIPFDRGLWGTATPAPPPRRALALADPLAGQVAGFAVVSEAGTPVLLAVRLRVVDGAVTEAETLVARPSDTIFSLDGFLRPRPLFDRLVDQAGRTDRALLAKIPHRYLDGILAADGDAIPVAEGCLRFENGVQTVLNPDAVGIQEEARDRGTWHLGVAAQVGTGIFADIEAARDRRVLVVDEDLGAVLAWFAFDHPGPLASRGGRSRFRTPNSMMAAEVFKVVGGQIQEIEAVLDVFPYGMRPGWT